MTIILLFYFSKAFDSLNHGRLLYKLVSKFTFSSSAVTLVRNYASGRFQRVYMEGQFLDLLGVPQIFSFYLFVLYLIFVIFLFITSITSNQFKRRILEIENFMHHTRKKIGYRTSREIFFIICKRRLDQY